MTVGFLSVFVVLATLHVCACVRGVKWLRTSTKPLLMPVLLAACLCSGAVSGFVIVALAFATIGDVLLIGSAKGGRLMLGAGSFFFGHLAYVCALAPGIRLTAADWWTLLMALLYVGIGYLLYRVVRQNLGPLRVLAVVYMVALEGMSLIALLRYATMGSWPALMVFVGSLIFVASDFFMFIDEFHHKLTRGGFAIMLTYCLAQGLMVSGLIFG